MSNALIGALRVSLGLDSAAFEEGLSLAEKKLNGFGKQMGKLGKSMQATGRSLSAYVTAPVVAMGVLTARTAGDFEAAMNRVGAATGATGDQLSQLEQLALDLGGATSKSASESADMLEMLAKNGLTAEQILDGAAEAAIKLSEATGGDLSRSADVATNVMAQFGKRVEDLGPIVDQITGVTLASQFGFDDYALALGQAGGVAGALGVDLTEFNAAIAATSDVFNSGSDAGTSFKTFLTRLVPASKQAATAMQDLGLEFFEANGQMKSLPEIAQELQDALAGLSDEARNDALNTIFGQDALRTAIALGNEGAAGISAMVEQINRKGIAEEQAAARMAGFNGEMEKLGGAFENLQIQIAKSGLLSFLTEMVSGLAGMIDKLSQTNPELLKWGTIIAAAAAAIGPFVLAIGLTASGIAGLISALPILGAALLALVSPIGLVVGAFAAIGAAWFYWDEIKAKFPEFAAVVETTGSAIMTAVQGIMEHMKLQITAITQLLTGDWRGAWETAKQMIQNFGTTLLSIAETLFPQTIAAMRTKAAELLAIFERLPAEMLRIGGQIIDGLWQGLKGKFQSVKDGLTGFASDLVGSVKSTLGIQSPSRVMHEVGVNIMQGLAGGMQSMETNVTGVAKGAADELKGSFEGVEQAAGSMFSGLGSSIAGLIKGTKDWRDVLSDVLGQIAQMALSNMGSMGGFGGFLSSLLGGLTGFASGGTIMPGGTGGIDSQVVAFRKSPNERVDITKPGQSLGGAGTVVINQTFPISGAITSADVQAMVQQGAASAVREVRDSLEGWQVRLGQDGAFA